MKKGRHKNLHGAGLQKQKRGEKRSGNRQLHKRLRQARAGLPPRAADIIKHMGAQAAEKEVFYMVRPKEVFISHSSKDKAAADMLVAALESSGLTAWIAPRDIPGGANYGAAITNGLRECEVLALVFSANSNESEAVFREVEMAFNNKKAIIPFRIEDVPVGDDLAFYLAGLHWIDAAGTGGMGGAEIFVRDARDALASRRDGAPPAKPPKPEPKPRQEKEYVFRVGRIGAAAAALAVVALLFFLVMRGERNRGGEEMAVDFRQPGHSESSEVPENSEAPDSDHAAGFDLAGLWEGEMRIYYFGADGTGWVDWVANEQFFEWSASTSRTMRIGAMAAFTGDFTWRIDDESYLRINMGIAGETQNRRYSFEVDGEDFMRIEGERYTRASFWQDEFPLAGIWRWGGGTYIFNADGTGWRDRVSSYEILSTHGDFEWSFADRDGASFLAIRQGGRTERVDFVAESYRIVRIAGVRYERMPALFASLVGTWHGHLGPLTFLPDGTGHTDWWRDGETFTWRQEGFGVELLVREEGGREREVVFPVLFVNENIAEFAALLVMRADAAGFASPPSLGPLHGEWEKVGNLVHVVDRGAIEWQRLGSGLAYVFNSAADERGGGWRGLEESPEEFTSWLVADGHLHIVMRASGLEVLPLEIVDEHIIKIDGELHARRPSSLSDLLAGAWLWSGGYYVFAADGTGESDWAGHEGPFEWSIDGSRIKFVRGGDELTCGIFFASENVAVLCDTSLFVRTDEAGLASPPLFPDLLGNWEMDGATYYFFGSGLGRRDTASPPESVAFVWMAAGGHLYAILSDGGTEVLPLEIIDDNTIIIDGAAWTRAVAEP